MLCSALLYSTILYCTISEGEGRKHLHQHAGVAVQDDLGLRHSPLGSEFYSPYMIIVILNLYNLLKGFIQIPFKEFIGILHEMDKPKPLEAALAVGKVSDFCDPERSAFSG